MKPYFKENLRYIAKIVGQDKKAEEVLHQYQQRIQEMQNSLSREVRKMKVSIIFYGEGFIWTISKGIYPISHILDDIGMHYKFVPYGEWNLSIETIDKFDTDIIFIIDVDEKTSNFYFKNPIFRSLKAVKNERAYIVNQEIWRTVGISGANRILDDLEKYLVNAPAGGKGE